MKLILINDFFNYVIPWYCMTSISCPRKRESGKAHHKAHQKFVFLCVYFVKDTNFTPKLSIFFLDSRFRGHDIENCGNDIRTYYHISFK